MVSAICVSLHPNPFNMRKIIPTLIAVFACILFVACSEQPKTLPEKIETLKQQVVIDAKTLKKIEAEDYALLQKDFVHCDSMLQHLSQAQVEACFEQLNLTNAYLIQFGEVRPVMERKIDYVIQQLDNLKTDVESHYLSDSLANIYFETENRVADTLHAQLEYFQNRFKSCKEALNKLKNSNFQP